MGPIVKCGQVAFVERQPLVVVVVANLNPSRIVPSVAAWSQAILDRPRVAQTAIGQVIPPAAVVGIAVAAAAWLAAPRIGLGITRVARRRGILGVWCQVTVAIVEWVLFRNWLGDGFGNRW